MWYYKGEPITQMPDDIQAFVYVITNNNTGKKYIGYKTVKSVRTRKIKGRKVKKTVDSPWKSYYSSSSKIQDELKEFGEGIFSREILYLCKTKTLARYLEAKTQFDRGVLFSDEYLNGIIQCRINRTHLAKEKLEYDKE